MGKLASVPQVTSCPKFQLQEVLPIWWQFNEANKVHVARGC